MSKRFLLGIFVFVLSLNVIGQASYYLAETTIIHYNVAPINEEVQTEKYKFNFKYNADGYVRYYAAYYWEEHFTDNLDFFEGWIGDSKDEYIDSNYELHIFYKWNYKSSDWMAVKKIERKCDSNKMEVYSLVSEKKGEQWIPSYKTEQQNVKNKKIHTEYTWSKESNNLVPSNKSEDDYNNKGELVFWSSYIWNNSHNQWLPVAKSKLRYNTKGQKKQQINYILKGSTWLRKSKTVFKKYDNKNNSDLNIFYNWSDSTHRWIETSRYDNTKKKSANLNDNKHWDAKTKTWIDNVKTECQYNSFEKEILSISYQWNTTDNYWEHVSKNEIEYDKNNNPIFTRSYKWWQGSWVLYKTEENQFKKMT